MQDWIIQGAASWDSAVLLAVFGALFLASGLTFIPRPVVCIAAGLIYGIAAFPFILTASTLSAVAAFLLARYFFRARVMRMIERRSLLKTLVQAVDAEGWRLLGLLRLASPVPGFVSNYSFGVTGMGLGVYTLTTALGSAPQIFIYLYLGSIGKIAMEDSALSSTRIGLGIAGFLGLFLSAVLVTRRVRRIVQVRLEARAAAAPLQSRL